MREGETINEMIEVLDYCTKHQGLRREVADGNVSVFSIKLAYKNVFQPVKYSVATDGNRTVMACEINDFCNNISKKKRELPSGFEVVVITESKYIIRVAIPDCNFTNIESKFTEFIDIVQKIIPLKCAA